MNVSPAFVIVMGMGVTFVGLISLILLVTLMGKVCGTMKKPAAAAPAAELPAVDKGALVAAVSAVIAEELGTDVNAFRIVSMKRSA